MLAPGLMPGLRHPPWHLGPPLAMDLHTLEQKLVMAAPLPRPFLMGDEPLDLVWR